MPKLKLIAYGGDNFRIVYENSGRAVSKDKSKYSDEKHLNEVKRCSISRTKREIKELILSNNFDYFATYTVNTNENFTKNNRFCLEDCFCRLRKILKSYKRKNKDFGYVLIAEEHKKGGYHFHGAVKGIPLSDIINYEEVKKNHKINQSILDAMAEGKTCYQHIPFENLGWTVLSPFDNYYKACNYIIKYVSKAPCKTDKNTIYIRSRGLKFADVFELPCVDLEYIFRNSPEDLKRIYKSEDKEKDYIHSLDFNFRYLPITTQNELFRLFADSQKKVIDKF